MGKKLNFFDLPKILNFVFGGSDPRVGKRKIVKNRTFSLKITQKQYHIGKKQRGIRIRHQKIILTLPGGTYDHAGMPKWEIRGVAA